MSVYKFAINGEEHEIEWSWWEVQSPLTAWVWIDITNDVVSNTWVLTVNGQSWNVTIQLPTFQETVYSDDSWQTYWVKVSTNPPAAWTADNIITIRKVL